MLTYTLTVLLAGACFSLGYVYGLTRRTKKYIRSIDQQFCAMLKAAAEVADDVETQEYFELKARMLEEKLND